MAEFAAADDEVEAAASDDAGDDNSELPEEPDEEMEASGQERACLRFKSA